MLCGLLRANVECGCGGGRIGTRAQCVTVAGGVTCFMPLVATNQQEVSDEGKIQPSYGANICDDLLLPQDTFPQVDR